MSTTIQYAKYSGSRDEVGDVKTAYCQGRKHANWVL